MITPTLKSFSAWETDAETLGTILGITGRRVRQLVSETVISKSGRGQYPVASAITAYVKWVQESRERVTPSEARERVLAARAEQIEMANKQTAHALIDTEGAIAAVDEVVGAYRTELAGLPARLTRDLDKRDEIEREIDGLLGRVTSIFHKRAAELRAEGAVSVQVDEVDE